MPHVETLTQPLREAVLQGAAPFLAGAETGCPKASPALSCLTRGLQDFACCPGRN